MPIPDGCSKSDNKTIFVIGPEASGSRLIARYVARAHKLHGWDGHGWICGPDACVLHCSLPYTKHRHWLDVEGCIRKYQNRFWILCTRDTHCSQSSSIQSKWTNTQRADNNLMASQVMQCLLLGQERTYVWSYETFMLLQNSYLKDLCEGFLGVKKPGLLQLKDGNRKYIK